VNHSASTSSALFAEGGAGTFRLLFYLLMALVLMVLDYRGGMLSEVRRYAGLTVEPLYWLASTPSRVVSSIREGVADRRALADENGRLRERLMVATAQLGRLQAVQRENQRYRELLDAAEAQHLDVQLVGIADVDLDPFRHRLLLDQGGLRGVRDGLALIDANGVVGQVIQVTPLNATAMLISDPNHAIPVQVVRSGLRGIAYGTGRVDLLRLPDLPRSADIVAGDELVTSGLGGRFPPGLTVGRVSRVSPDETRLFIVAEAAPAAHLDRAGDLLLVWNSPGQDAGPRAPDEEDGDAPHAGVSSP